MKVTVQEKVAELERRIVALESRPNYSHTVIKAASTHTVTGLCLEPELSGLWASFDRLMAKAFKR